MSRLDRHHPPAPFAGTRIVRPTASPARRIALLASLVTGVAAALLLGGTTADLGDPDLAVVLRTTAATKALIILGAAWLVDWRLRHPAGRATAAALIVAVTAALSGTALMFGLAEFRAGAALHYAGLAALGFLAWRDRAAIAAILAARASRR